MKKKINCIYFPPCLAFEWDCRATSEPNDLFTGYQLATLKTPLADRVTSNSFLNTPFTGFASELATRFWGLCFSIAAVYSSFSTTLGWMRSCSMPSLLTIWSGKKNNIYIHKHIGNMWKNYILYIYQKRTTICQ